jgi:hypothetical protein
VLKNTSQYSKIKRRYDKMTTLREEALTFQPKEKLNAADLPLIDLDDAQVTTIEGTDSEGKAYNYKAIIYGSREYYVSPAVLFEIKKILKLKPEAKKFRVKKTGSGKGTKYEVEFIQ